MPSCIGVHCPAGAVAESDVLPYVVAPAGIVVRRPGHSNADLDHQVREGGVRKVLHQEGLAWALDHFADGFAWDVVTLKLPGGSLMSNEHLMVARRPNPEHREYATRVLQEFFLVGNSTSGYKKARACEVLRLVTGDWRVHHGPITHHCTLGCCKSERESAHKVAAAVGPLQVGIRLNDRCTLSCSC